ncbi:transposase [Streptomyces sp. NBC_01336]|uniref:transposase n=1 Tax=Streptomyces sp. NBC_01336 TaxID=2903829 RepID=UPI003FCC8693
MRGRDRHLEAQPTSGRPCPVRAPTCSASPTPRTFPHDRENPGRPPTWTRRQVINGVRFRSRTGVPWRDVLVRYSPWGRSCELSAADSAPGSVDSTVCRDHPHAAGARKEGGSARRAARWCRR